jgi:hypothetical protein
MARTGLALRADRPFDLAPACSPLAVPLMVAMRKHPRPGTRNEALLQRRNHGTGSLFTARGYLLKPRFE